jgi:hypothetical protein
VYCLAVDGSTVYAAGVFSSIGGQSRSYLAALDASTGLATAWNPGANGEVVSLAVSGPTVYVGGGFTSIGGQSRSCIAALDAGTGLATAWNPGASGPSYPYVHSLAVSGSTVYAGGGFTSIGGQNRARIAALDAGTGLATAWNPGANGEVRSLAMSGSAVCAGGYFNRIGGQYRPWFAVLRDSDGIAPAVQVLTPNAGDVLLLGTLHALTWDATDAVGVQSVDLYLSRSGPSGPWEPLAAGAANSGTYNWLVSGASANNSAYLRVDARDYDGNLGSGMSAAAFTVANLATPTLVELFRAEPADAGVRIEWRLSDPSAFRSIALERSASAQGAWTSVSATPVVEGRTTSVLDATAVAAVQWYRLAGLQRDGRSFTFGPISVGAEDAVTAFALSPLSPNPSTGRSFLTFAIPRSTPVRLALLDVQGREVAVLAHGVHEPGRYTAALEASDLRAGCYFVRMQARGVDLTRRVVVVK